MCFMQNEIYISYNDQIINDTMRHLKKLAKFIYISYNDQIINKPLIVN